MNYDYPNAEKMERFEYGIRRYWLDDGHLVVIASEGDMSRAALDRWTGIIIETIGDWSNEGDIYSILDLTGDKQGFTPYSRKSAQDIYNCVGGQERHVIVAIIMKDTIFNKLLNVFLLGMIRGMSNMTQKFFLTHDEGVAWVRKQIASRQQAAKTADSQPPAAS